MIHSENRQSTIKDLAVFANVSIMTVSRYFNQPERVSPKTQKKIEKAISELNYTPNAIARSMVTNRTNTIGVMVPDIRNDFYSELIHSIEEFGRQYKYHILLSNTQEDADLEHHYINLLMGRKVDGFIIAPVSEKSVKFLKKMGQHFVLVDRHFYLDGINCIACDHYQGMQDALVYLTSLGHYNIGFLHGPGQVFSFAERNRAFSDMIKSGRICADSGYVRKAGIRNTEDAYLCTKELMRLKERPTAIIASNNIMGVGTLEALKDMNLQIPEDISVLTFDKIRFSELLSYKLTYVEQPIDVIGRTSASMLFKELTPETNNPETRKIFFKPQIIYGNSCKNLLAEKDLNIP